MRSAPPSPASTAQTPAHRGPDALRPWKERLRAAGATDLQQQRLWFHWLRGRPLAGAGRGSPFSKRVLAEVAEFEAEIQATLAVESQTASADGALRFVLRLADGRRVEAVSLPSGSACLSSQVGCAVACRFCMTGSLGLERQLSGLEILASFVELARERPQRRALFMGMGEPAHNLEAVLGAGRALAEAGELGRHHVVVSSVGSEALFERLEAGPFRPALALSLHSVDDRLRQELLPHAPPLSVDALIERGEAYARLEGYPIQYQWALLAGINDSDKALLAAAELLRGKSAVLNLIPWNPLPELPFERPDPERCRHLVRLLMRAGILTKLRWSAGLEARAACGQLRGRQLAEPGPDLAPKEP